MMIGLVLLDSFIVAAAVAIVGLWLAAGRPETGLTREGNQ